MLLKNFYQDYVVITLQAVNARGEDTPHIHSIVVKIGDDVVAFDINGLLDTLIGTSMEELCPELESKYVPTPGVGSSTSRLTHVDRRARKSAEPIPDYKKFAKVQTDFWKEYEGCYIFGQVYVPARDKYVIRKLQPKIVKSVKAELVQLGDEKMRQKVCLTLIDRESKLL